MKTDKTNLYDQREAILVGYTIKKQIDPDC